MPRYHMAGLEPPTDHLTDLAEQVEGSDVFRQRALEWYSLAFDRYPDACEQAFARFRASPEFSMLVEDVADGEVSIDGGHPQATATGGTK